MEKKDITISKPNKYVLIDYGNILDIQVKPFLSIDDKGKIANAYISLYFDEDKAEGILLNDFQAEYALVLSVITLCTNLSINTSDENQIDYIVESGLWDAITKSIVNYTDFKKQLDNMVEHVREDIALKQSVGAAFNKIASALEEFSKLDFSEENILNAFKTIEDKTEKLQKDILDIPTKKLPAKKRAKKETS